MSKMSVLDLIPGIISMMIVAKLFGAAIFLYIIIYFLIYCERFVFYSVLSRCKWPQLDPKNEESIIKTTNETLLRFMVITDTHLLGSKKGYWHEKIYTNWEMKTAFQTAINLHQPDLVFVLGDLTDEGAYCNDAEFNKYTERFYNLFAVPKNMQMYVIAGNHDIEFHKLTNAKLQQRFQEGFNAPPVQLLTIRGNHFVLINSINLEDDGCSLCAATEFELANIENTIKCTKGEPTCNSTTKLKSYSRPILIQHFPLYRESDEQCSEPDEASYPEKIETFIEAWDCLSKNATNKLLYQLNPRLVLDGHTHHGCTRDLPNGKGVEITVPSFNWRFKDNPSYELVVATPNSYALKKCLMPTRRAAVIRCIFCLSCLIVGIMFMCCNRPRLKRGKKCFIIV